MKVSHTNNFHKTIACFNSQMQTILKELFPTFKTHVSIVRVSKKSVMSCCCSSSNTGSGTNVTKLLSMIRVILQALAKSGCSLPLFIKPSIFFFFLETSKNKKENFIKKLMPALKVQRVLFFTIAK